MNTPLISLSNLRCERDNRVLFEGLNFDLYSGQIIQLVGANGSGKTTLLRSVCGLSSFFTGEILWCGQDLAKQRYDFLKNSLYLGHALGVKGNLTPRENLHWSAALNGHCSAEQVQNALIKVGLAGLEDTLCFSLSAGQQRRVNLARLFLTDYRLWILDEPMTAIDKRGVEEIEGWISTFVSLGGAVLITTHQSLRTTHSLKQLDLQKYAP